MPNDINLNDDPPDEEEAFTKSLENILEPEDIRTPPLREEAELSPEKQESALQIFQRERTEFAERKKRKLAEEEKVKAGGKNAKAKSEPDCSSAVPEAPRSPQQPPPSDFSRQYEMARQGPQNLPEGWLDCPRLGHPIGHLYPSKVPLGESFDDIIEPGQRYTPKIMMEIFRKTFKKKIGLVLDLTNSTRYYDTKEWKRMEVTHIKIACRGRDETPEESKVNEFVWEVDQFLGKASNHDKCIVVHCTHGFNRTGFMIAHYVMRSAAKKEGGVQCTVGQAIQCFSANRFPGIYKEEYILALFDHYHEKRPPTSLCPPVPKWKKGEEDEEEGEAADVIDPRLGSVSESPCLSIDDVLGDAISDSHQAWLQWLVCTALGKNHRSRPPFPGSQPVSLDKKSLKQLMDRYFYVTWKADGTRYLLIMMVDGCYLMDRNGGCRRTHMRFPIKPPHPARVQTPYPPVHHFTLLDGEMVIDKVPDPQNPSLFTEERRYLVYDMMVLNGTILKDHPFHERWSLINAEVYVPKKVEMGTSIIYDASKEVFKVRRKDFWQLSATHKVFTDVIAKLPHEADGLVFQAYDDKYVAGTHEGLLKWKFAHMNSVDFKLKLTEGGQPRLLLVDNRRERLLEGAKLNLKEGMNAEDLRDKVIECCCVGKPGDNVWEFMRIRYDKEHPNAWRTYEKVLDSIKDNITEAVLLPKIDEICKSEQYAKWKAVDDKKLVVREQQHAKQYLLNMERQRP